jgi:Mn-dependent DtxR family transcriptional regulator
MNEAQLIDTLKRLAHYVVRNEIVCEHFLTQKLPVSRDEIGAKVREVDEHLTANTEW